MSSYVTATTALKFGGGRFRFPTQIITSTAGGNNLATVSRLSFFTPAYPCADMQFLFVNYYVNINGISGAELGMGNPLPVQYSFRVNGGAWRTGMIGGSATPTLADRSNNWSDTGLVPETIPPRTEVDVVTLESVTEGQFRPGGVRPLTTSGVTEFGRRDAVVANLTTYLSGTAMVTNLSGVDVSMYGPAGVICKAPPNVHSVLILGDSIAYNRNATLTTATSLNLQGDFSIGLDAAEFGANNAAIQGIKLQWESQSDATSSFVLRPAAYTMLPQLPFDIIIGEAGENDVTSSGTLLSTVQGFLTNNVARLRTYFPGVRIGWTTPQPHVNTAGDYTTFAGQVVPTWNALGAVMFQLRDWERIGNAGGVLDFVYDLTPFFGDKAGIDHWRSDLGSITTDDGTHKTDLGHAFGATVIRNAAQSGAMQ